MNGDGNGDEEDQNESKSTIPAKYNCITHKTHGDDDDTPSTII